MFVKLKLKELRGHKVVPEIWSKFYPQPLAIVKELRGHKVVPEIGSKFYPQPLAIVKCERKE